MWNETAEATEMHGALRASSRLALTFRSRLSHVAKKWGD
jgi:hypothetical protein